MRTETKAEKMAEIGKSAGMIIGFRNLSMKSLEKRLEDIGTDAALCAREDKAWLLWYVTVGKNKASRNVPVDLIKSFEWYSRYWNQAIGLIKGSSDWGCIRCSAVLKDLSMSSITKHVKSSKHEWRCLLERSEARIAKKVQRGF